VTLLSIKITREEIAKAQELAVTNGGQSRSNNLHLAKVNVIVVAATCN
jgi:hypothetical protein